MKEDFLKEIWQIHTEVQEQMLRLNSVPISIMPNSARIEGEKLYLIADESDKTDKIIDEIVSLFKISKDDFRSEDGYFLVDKVVAQGLKYEQKAHLSEKAARNYVKFLPLPVIDGYISKKKSPIAILKRILDSIMVDYTFDKRKRLQISVSDLKKLEQLTLEDNVRIQIPETASIVLSIRPNPLFFLRKAFPEISATHKIQWIKKKDETPYNGNERVHWIRTIEIIGGYFKPKVADQFNEEFGLSLIGYDLTFYINPDAISKYDPVVSKHTLPKLNKETNSFTFHTSLKESEISDPLDINHEDDWDFDLKYSRLKKFFYSFFGAENVKFEAKFLYHYDLYKFDTEFLPRQEYSKEKLWEEIHLSMRNDGISFSEYTNSIGIDFNWKNANIEDVITGIFNRCPFINFAIYKNHRCNIDFTFQDIKLDEVENVFRENFPSIQTHRNDNNGIIIFYQEYKTQEQANMLKEMIFSELNDLDNNSFNFDIFPVPDDKEKYILSIDAQSRKEAQVTVVKELRGSEFIVAGEDFGKLFRINYPELIFDISGENYEKTKHIFDNMFIDSIEPNLIGDIEKINRLKESFNNILRGKNLQNQNLKDFIFDAEKAEKTEDVEIHISPSGSTYQELQAHLLNSKINDSQSQAIIKTILAKDLALIQGPPGTGKSTAIAEMIWQHIRKDAKERILLTSETNLAVDNAIDRIVNNYHNLVKPIRIGGDEKLEIEGRQFSTDLMKKWVENGTIEEECNGETDEDDKSPQKLILLNWIENICRRIDVNELDETSLYTWIKLLREPSKELRNLIFKIYLKNCNVIGATCSSIGKISSRGKWTNFYRSYQEIFGANKTLQFTTVIQDESSKATPAELSLPLIYGKKNIIIGDHRQLPPLLDKEEFKLSFDFLLDRVEEKDERKKLLQLKSFIIKHFDEMEISHFERLFKKIDQSLKGIFNLQYRMHPDINEVIRQFYLNDGGLECGLNNPVDLGVNDPDLNNPASRYHGIELDDYISKDSHVIWIDTESPELLDGTSRKNYGEVEAIKDLLTRLRYSGSFKRYQKFWKNNEDRQIGLISFYGKQIGLLKNLRNEFKDIPMRISTVDRFQGMERNIIIVSMVRSNRIASDKHQKPDYQLYGELGYQEQKDLGFAQSPNRLNVAMSRAKRLLIIVGNSGLFRQNPIYENVYQVVLNRNGIRKYPTI